MTVYVIVMKELSASTAAWLIGVFLIVYGQQLNNGIRYIRLWPSHRLNITYIYFCFTSTVAAGFAKLIIRLFKNHVEWALIAASLSQSLIMLQNQ